MKKSIKALKRERMMKRKSTKLKKNIALVSVIALAAAAALFVIVTRVSAHNASLSSGLNRRMPLIADQDLVIQVADITENALFYPVDIDNMRIEVFAVRAPDGTIRTAFNTCQICYASGRGYFVQVGSVLVCQQCGNHYEMSQVEMEAGGCNPVPIFPADKIETPETITISRDHLIQTRALFLSWR